MSNINDYLDWRGDLLINKNSRFNEIDSMILARFSYLIFYRIQMEARETIESISNKMKNFENEEFRFNGDKELITKLGISQRFKDMIVTDFVETNEKETEKQFGAITIHISRDEMYVSYIGTDSSIYGWKEDFNMSFMDNVPCQIEGKEYLERIAKKYPRKKIRIGGHSKGGNVAMYSAIMANKRIQDRIIKVYNYDGPGFNSKFIKLVENMPIIKKLETYLPQDSVIGRIMEHKDKCEVIRSNEKGIMQHDIYSWEVLGTDLIKQEKLTDDSEIINQTLNDWLENTTNEQRKVFLDGIFELFYSTDAKTFSDISKNLSNNIKAILKTYHNISETDKEIITEMLKIFAKVYFSVVKEAKVSKFEIMKDHYIKEGKKLIGGLFMKDNIKVITQNAIRIKEKGGKIIYFDPFRINGKYSNDADLIFITHSHFDHFSPEDIRSIKKEDTKIIVTEDLKLKAKTIGFTEDNILEVFPDNQYEIDGFFFETIPAYNINKEFHKKDYNWVGYIITIDDKKVYVAGDTDATFEAENIKCDIAFVPIGGIYTMNWKEAAELVKKIKPKLAIPTHYASIVGSPEDGNRFKKELEGEIQVELLIK